MDDAHTPRVFGQGSRSPSRWRREKRRFKLPAAVLRRNRLATAAYLLAAGWIAFACLGNPGGIGIGTAPFSVEVQDGKVHLTNTDRRPWLGITVSLGVFQATQLFKDELPPGGGKTWTPQAAPVPCLVLVTAHRPEGGLPGFWIGFAR